MFWLVLYVIIVSIMLNRVVSSVVDDYNSHKTVFTLGKAEFVGKIPVRQDITVLPADDPKRPRTNLEVLASGGEVRFPKCHINDIELIKEKAKKHDEEDRNIFKNEMSSLMRDAHEEALKECDKEVFEQMYKAIEEAKGKE